mgnify:CR=1 FL=1
MKSIITFLKSTTLLGKGITLSLSTLLAYILSMKTILLGVVILIFFDLITGIRAGLHKSNTPFNPFKKGFWKSIKSYLLRKTWRKAYEYGIGIIVVSIIETFIFGSPVSIMLLEKTFTLTEMAAVIPAIVEGWSIFENFEAVSGKNILKTLVTLLPEKLQALFPKNGTQDE